MYKYYKNKEKDHDTTYNPEDLMYAAQMRYIVGNRFYSDDDDGHVKYYMKLIKRASKHHTQIRKCVLDECPDAAVALAKVVDMHNMDKWNTIVSSARKMEETEKRTWNRIRDLWSDAVSPKSKSWQDERLSLWSNGVVQWQQKRKRKWFVPVSRRGAYVSWVRHWLLTTTNALHVRCRGFNRYASYQMYLIYRRGEDDYALYRYHARTARASFLQHLYAWDDQLYGVPDRSPL